MTAYDRVCRAISFQKPDRVPVWRINDAPHLGDVFSYDLRIQVELPKAERGPKEYLSEWGYVIQILENGTLGLPQKSALASWEMLDCYAPPKADAKERFSDLPNFLQISQGYYRLAMCAINGFNTFAFIRGFENALVDLYEEPGLCGDLLNIVFDWEQEMISLCAERGFHGYHIGDDLGTQQTLLINPEIWRSMILPRYADLVRHAHERNMHIWFHSCGNITKIVPDLFKCGVDVINLSQPNVVDIDSIGRELKGRACFLAPISYQTTSISGTKEAIFQEAKRLYRSLGHEKGGFIGYVEKYDSIGMPSENYQHCCDAYKCLLTD